MRRRRLKKATPAGPKKEAPGVKFDPPGVQFRVLGSPKRASGDLLKRLGRQVGLRRAFWARKGQLENCMEGSWDRLGVLLAPLRPVSDRLSPPWGGPGEAPGGHFWRYFGVIFGSIFGAQEKEVKMNSFKCFLCILGSFLYYIYCPLLPSLLRGRRRRAHIKILKFLWLLWVASHMRLFLAAPEAI